MTLKQINKWHKIYQTKLKFLKTHELNEIKANIHNFGIRTK